MGPKDTFRFDHALHTNVRPEESQDSIDSIDSKVRKMRVKAERFSYIAFGSHMPCLHAIRGTWLPGLALGSTSSFQPHQHCLV